MSPVMKVRLYLLGIVLGMVISAAPVMLLMDRWKPPRTVIPFDGRDPRDFSRWREDMDDKFAEQKSKLLWQTVAAIPGAIGGGFAAAALIRRVTTKAQDGLVKTSPTPEHPC